MPREIHPRDVVSVPCRRCGEFLPVRVEPGELSVACGSCGGVTIVTIRRIKDDWRILTSAAEEPPSGS